MPNQRPPIAIRRLRRELRQLRGTRSARSVADALGWSETKLTRLETASIAPRPATVAELLDHYNADGKHRERLLGLVAASHNPSPWGSAEALLPPGVADYYDLEDACTTIRTCAPNEIPGILRTATYGAAVLARRIGDTPEAQQLCAQVHQRRLDLLARPDAPHIWAIIDEAALRRTVVDTDVMRGQLERLLDLTTRPHIHVQVLRLVDGTQPGWTPFTLLDFGDEDPEIVCAETAIGLHYVDGHATTDYRQAFERHLAHALPVEASHEMVEKLLAELS